MAYDVERDGPSNGGAEGSSSGGLHSTATIGPSSDVLYHTGDFSVSGSSSSRRKKDKDEITNAYNYALYLDNLQYNTTARKQAQEWEEYMSSTAIQRQMEDMKKAGINPILAAKYGGASYNGVSPNYSQTFPTYSNDYGLAAYENSARQQQISKQAQEERETLKQQLTNSESLAELAHQHKLNEINLDFLNTWDLEEAKHQAQIVIDENRIALEDKAKKNEYAYKNNMTINLFDVNKELIEFQGRINKEIAEISGQYGLANGLIGSTARIGTAFAG